MENYTMTIKVFVSCPGDVEQEKLRIKKICEKLNRNFGEVLQFHLEVVEFKEDVVPRFAPGPQEQINRVIGENYDVYIGIMWKRFGTPAGRTHPKTGEVFDSGTEEEFELAFLRWKQTGSPEMNFYFKSKGFEKVPTEEDEIQQLSKVARFKRRLKQEHGGWVQNFEDLDEFSEQVEKFLIDVVKKTKQINTRYNLDVIESSSHESLVIPKFYPETENYMPRLIVSTEKQEHVDFHWERDSLQSSILDVVKNKKRVVLLGDAGTGKSAELQALAAACSNKGTLLFPVLIELNQYIDDSLPTLLDSIWPEWRQVPEDRLLFLLDGLDEVESKNKKDVLRRIESFVTIHPQAHLVVSCRTNFYRTETEKSGGTLRGFSSFRLLNLDLDSIRSFLDIRVGSANAQKFADEVARQRLSDLIRIPFYLVHLSSLFVSNGTLPETKALLFEALIRESMSNDIKHYNATFDLDFKQQDIRNLLERLAIGMETLGRNFVTDEEFNKLVPESTERELLMHCKLWQKKETPDRIWQFEHNNFQEYLAAQVLAREPIDTIKYFVSFPPEHCKIIPAWVNTLSFLFSILDPHSSKFKQLLDFIQDCEPELIVKFENDRIAGELRTILFKRIFQDAKEKKIWIDRDKFYYDELALFAPAIDVVPYLLDELQNADYYIIMCNAIRLLRHVKLPYGQRGRAREVLVSFALDNEKGEIVQNSALLALADLNLYKVNIVDKIVEELRTSKSDWVRFGLYYFLQNSEHLDDHVNVFLEGIKYTKEMFDEGRLGDERWHLKEGLAKVTAPQAIRTILQYFVDYPNSLDSLYYGDFITRIARNAANAYFEDENILSIAINLFVCITKNYRRDEKNQFLTFFVLSGARETACRILFEQWVSRPFERDHLRALVALISQEEIDFLVQQYEERELANRDIWALLSHMRWQNVDTFEILHQKVKLISKNKFVIPPERDYESERREHVQKDFSLLFDEEKFVFEVKQIFENEQKTELAKDDILELFGYDEEGNKYSQLALRFLYNLARPTKLVSLEKAITVLESMEWDWYSISKIYENLRNNSDISVSQEQQKIIEYWCRRNLEKVDYRTVLVASGNGGASTSNSAIFLWYFLRKFDLQYPKSVLLDMLSFDWPDESVSSGWEFYEARLNEVELAERVLENLQIGIRNDDVLQNHLNFSRKQQLEEAVPFALEVIADEGYRWTTRNFALEFVLERSSTLIHLEQVLLRIQDDFRWDVVSKLVERDSTYCRKFLLELLENSGDEKDRLVAAEYLMRLQEFIGLQYLVCHISRENRYHNDQRSLSPLLSLKMIEAVPSLLNLLSVTYRPDFEQQDRFSSLENVIWNALTNLATHTDSHYRVVRRAVGRFIEVYTGIYEKIHFLNMLIDRIDANYYLTKQGKVELDEVIKRLEKLRMM